MRWSTHIAAPSHAARYGPSSIDTLGGVRSALAVRSALQPYLESQVELLAKRGQPFMRPLWFDFADDPAAQGCEDQFMFGPDFMVAPVTEPNATNRTVVFPSVMGGTLFKCPFNTCIPTSKIPFYQHHYLYRLKSPTPFLNLHGLAERMHHLSLTFAQYAHAAYHNV
jgi:hypothetical protein